MDIDTGRGQLFVKLEGKKKDVCGRSDALPESLRLEDEWIA